MFKKFFKHYRKTLDYHFMRGNLFRSLFLSTVPPLTAVLLLYTLLSFAILTFAPTTVFFGSIAAVTGAMLVILLEGLGKKDDDA